jgi:hypothetical protein
LNCCPCANDVPAAGELIVATGAAFVFTVSVAALLVAEPALFVTTARNCAALSVGCVCAIV